MGKLNEERKNKIETPLKNILLKGKEIFLSKNNFLHEKMKKK
jgi:hypothetical protein